MRAFWEGLFEASARSKAATDPGESWVLADQNETGQRLMAWIEEARQLSEKSPLFSQRIEIIEHGVLKPYLDQVAEAKKWTETPLPQLKVAGTRQDVRLDGRLDDAIWPQAEESADFVTMYNSPMPVRTTVRVVREKNALVMGFHCDEPRMDELVTHHLSSSAGICTDDSVEINLAFPGKAKNASGASDGTKNYLQIMANAAGWTWHWWRGKYNPGEPKDLGIECAVAKLDDDWQAEIRIPLSLFGDPESRFEGATANFMRNRPRSQDPRSNTEKHGVWSPTFTGGFQNPNRFGKLIFPETNPD